MTIRNMMGSLIAGSLLLAACSPPPARPIPVVGDTAGETPIRAQTEAEREAQSETPTNEGADAFWHLRLQDEHGNIPDDGYSRALAQMRKMSAGPTNNSRSRSPDAVDGAGINRNSWTFRGLVGNGGAISSLAIHPQNPQIMLAGAPTGGIHKTTDGGATWRVIDDFMPSVEVSTIVFNPANPSTVFAGTSGSTGQGIFRSTNAGDTWEQLPTAAPSANPNLKYIQRLAMPANGQTVLAATEFLLIRSTDNGATWPAVTINVLDGIRYRAVAFHPSDNNRALAAANQGVYFSTDGGANWAQAGGTNAIDFGEVSYGPGQRVYALAQVGRGELWRSDDGGQSFTKVYVSTNTFNLRGTMRYLWVSPTDPNVVMVGGELDMFRTNDGGTTWTKISDWGLEQQRHGHFGTGDPSPHADQQTAVSHPGFNGTTNQTMWVGSHGGIYRTDIAHTAESNRGWIDVNNNLAISQFYGARAITGTLRFAGGTQDNGSQVQRADGKWIEYSGGDGGYEATDPTDPTHIYGEYIYLAIHRSSNGGVNAQNIAGRGKQAPYLIGDSGDGATANFIAPFILDPNNPNRLLAGGASLWRSNDVKTPNTATEGPQWAVIKAPSDALISAIEVAPGNSDIVWVGHNDGKVFLSTNGTVATPTWAPIGAGTLPARMVNRITVDPRSTNTVYVVFGGFSPDNVWKTTDGGTTWANVSGTGDTALPALPVYSLVLNPNNSSWLYIGTEMGIFTSENGGANWFAPGQRPSNDGPGNVRVAELFWVNGTTLLGAATYGRGIWTAETVAGQPGAPQCLTVTVVANPANGGTVALSPGNCNGTQYLAGTVVTLRATAAAGNAFANWSGDTTGATNPTVITVNANATVTANFVAQATCFTLTLTAANGNITTNPAPNCNQTQYTQNTQVALTLTPNPGYTLNNWSGDATGNTNPVTVTMDANKAVTANLTANCYTLTTNATNGTLAADPAGNCNAGAGYTHGTVVTVTATPSATFVFANWTGDLTNAFNPNRLTLDANKTLTANFVAATDGCFTLNLGAPSGGTIAANPQPNCNGVQYTAGTVVTLSATAGTGFAFANWTDAASGATSPTNVTMDANKTASAVFTAQCFALGLNVVPTGKGSIAADAPNCNGQYAMGSNVRVTATASAGNGFVGWSGSTSGNQSQALVVINGTEAVTASFGALLTNDAIQAARQLGTINVYLPLAGKQSTGAVAAVAQQTQVARPSATQFFTITQTTRGATTSLDDPNTCSDGVGGLEQASVWFKFIPSQTGTLSVDTIGSDYDTVLQVWRGTPGNLTSQACDDDLESDPDLTSDLNNIPVQGGVTYYIEVADGSDLQVGDIEVTDTEPPPAGGFLVLHGEFTPN